MGHIGPSATRNSLSIRSMFQIGTDFLHIFRMNWMKKVRNIVLCLVNNGVTFCPPWRLKITGKWLRLKSRNLRPISQRQPIMTVMRIQGCHIRRRQVLISYRPASIRSIIPPSILVPIVTAYCARRQKYLSASGDLIAPKIDLEKVPTRNRSRMAWGGGGGGGNRYAYFKQ